MGAYYYLASQLPYLVYGQNPPMTSSAFKALAAEAMGASEARQLAFCTLDGEPAPRGAPEFVKQWKEWERALRLNLARGRVAKLKRESSFDAPDLPLTAAGAAKNALSIESPLEAEIFLDKARWDAIESLRGINNFNENAIYAYLLKLLLMERRAAFKTDEGFNEYKGLYAAILGNDSTHGVAK